MPKTKQQLIDLAEAQLLGWSNGAHGYSLISLIQSMGLTQSQWESIKTQYPNTLNKSECEEVDNYFNQ